MKKTFKLMALAAILLPVMSSCGGSSETTLFGALPGTFTKYLQEKDALEEEGKNIQSEADKAKFIEKSKKMEEEWTAKIEETAKGLDGKQIEFAESDIKVTEPISLELKSVSSSSLAPTFNIKGAAETATEITLDYSYEPSSVSVYVVGYNAEGTELFKIHAGSVAVSGYADGKATIAAGTPVELKTLSYVNKDTENYIAATELKLEVRQ